MCLQTLSLDNNVTQLTVGILSASRGLFHFNVNICRLWQFVGHKQATITPDAIFHSPQPTSVGLDHYQSHSLNCLDSQPNSIVLFRPKIDLSTYSLLIIASQIIASQKKKRQQNPTHPDTAKITTTMSEVKLWSF